MTSTHSIDGSLQGAHQPALLLLVLDWSRSVPVLPLEPPDQDPTILNLAVKRGLLGLFAHSLDLFITTSRILGGAFGAEPVVLGLALFVHLGTVSTRANGEKMSVTLLESVPREVGTHASLSARCLAFEVRLRSYSSSCRECATLTELSA